MAGMTDPFRDRWSDTDSDSGERRRDLLLYGRRKGERLVSLPRSSSEGSLPQAMASPLDECLGQFNSLHNDLAQRGTQGENYLILAPTASDKLAVTDIIVSTHLLRRGGRGRVVILAAGPTQMREYITELQASISECKISVCPSDKPSKLSTVHQELVDSEVVVCTAEKLLESLHEKRMSFVDVTLLIVDNFHLVHRTPHLTDVLHTYLVQRHKDGNLAICQIIGVSTVGDVSKWLTPEFESTIRHLLSLCTIMDATSGLKLSRSYLDTLDLPVYSFEVSYQRSLKEPFIERVTQEITRLEQKVDLRCPFRKWSDEYTSLLNQKREFLATKANTEDRNQSTILDMLDCYCKTLRVYMEARFEDAFSVLLTHTFTDPEDKLQEELAQGLQDVKAGLTLQQKVDNPILVKLEESVIQEALENPHMVMLLVACSEQQAYGLNAWFLDLSEVEDVQTHPYLFSLGSESDTPELIAAEVQAFESGPYNILITTPDVADAIDLKSCTTIIRVQTSSLELAVKIMRGSPSLRRPLCNSAGCSIFSSTTTCPLSQLKQEELEASLKRAVQLLPSGKALQEQLQERQKKTVRVYSLRQQNLLARGQRKRRPDSSEVVLELKCKVCNSLAVHGSDIFMVEEGTQCVVPTAGQLSGRISLKPHLPPKHMIGSLVETQRIHCASCGTEWGALCYWPLKGHEFHVLRCRSFVFEINGSPHTVKRWSEVPFNIPPLSTHPDFPGDSSDSGTQSDEECSDSDHN